MKKQVDFTEGNIVWAIVRFSIPLILGELLQNLYNSVDALVAGNLVDQNALAAVTVCGVIANLVVNFFNAMSIGSNVVVAKANGSGERERLCHTIRVTFSFGVVLGVLLSLFGILLSPQLLRLAGAQESYLRDALIYLRIYLAGLMFTVIYNNAAGILRALGRADIPFRILVVSCGMNIALDLLFVSVFDMGIAGVGVATVLSQAVSVAMAYRTISREIQSRCLDLREMYREGGHVIGEVLRIGMEKIRDKGTRSAVKRVDPMRSQTGLPREEILQVFFDHFKEKYNATVGTISAEDLAVARERCETKFAREEWVHRIP